MFFFLCKYKCLIKQKIKKLIEYGKILYIRKSKNIIMKKLMTTFVKFITENLDPEQEEDLDRLNSMDIRDILHKLNYLKYIPDELPPQYNLSKWSVGLYYDIQKDRWVYNNYGTFLTENKTISDHIMNSKNFKMKYIKNLSQYLFEKLSTANGRKMRQLVDYFEKSIEEKEEELPEFFDKHYPNILENWSMENSSYFLELDDYDTEEEAYENIIYPEASNELIGNAKKAYKEFLIGVVDNISNNNPYDLDYSMLPLYVTYNYEGDAEDEWLVHFTGNDENIQFILNDKCFRGISNMDNLAITATADEWVEDGYCFAFDLQNIQYNFRDGGSKYGNSGILFKSSGIKLHHNGDDEIQVVFIGNQVNNMIPFWYDSDTKEFYNKNNTIRTKESDDFFEEMTK